MTSTIKKKKKRQLTAACCHSTIVRGKEHEKEKKKHAIYSARSTCLCPTISAWWSFVYKNSTHTHTHTDVLCVCTVKDWMYRQRSVHRRDGITSVNLVGFAQPLLKVVALRTAHTPPTCRRRYLQVQTSTSRTAEKMGTKIKCLSSV